MALGQQRLVGLQQGVELAGIVPPAHLGGEDAAAVLDHVLECIGEIILALVGRRGQYVIDPGPERVHVPDVVKPYVGQLRHRFGGLLDDAGHEALVIGDHHSEALVVFHFLGPDDSVGVSAVD